MEDLLLGIRSPAARRGNIQVDPYGNYWVFTEDNTWQQIMPGIGTKGIKKAPRERG